MYTGIIAWLVVFSAGDSTVRLWPFKNTDETKDVTSLVLSPEDKNTVSNGLASGKDVTALEWNVSLFLLP